MTKSSSSPHTSVPHFAHLQNGLMVSLNLYLGLVNLKIMEIMEEHLQKRSSSSLVFGASFKCYLGDIIKSMRLI